MLDRTFGCFQVSAGGLVSALMGVQSFETCWIGWPGRIQWPRLAHYSPLNRRCMLNWRLKEGIMEGGVGLPKIENAGSTIYMKREIFSLPYHQCSKTHVHSSRSEIASSFRLLLLQLVRTWQPGKAELQNPHYPLARAWSVRRVDLWPRKSQAVFIKYPCLLGLFVPKEMCPLL